MFATALDAASPVSTPASGTAASALTDTQLGSISRRLAANVRSASSGPIGVASGHAPGGGLGAPNLELVIADPRPGAGAVPGQAAAQRSSTATGRSPE
jgi:hypothetical protein